MITDDYPAIYWAAARIAMWSGCGVSDGQLSDAVNRICDKARLTVPQEAVLRDLVGRMTKGGSTCH